MSDFNPATLKYIRKSLNWTQEALASKCGIAREMISDWERGKHVPRTENIEKLEGIFDLSAGDLSKSPMELFGEVSANYIPIILETAMQDYLSSIHKSDLKERAHALHALPFLLPELQALHGVSTASPAPTDAQVAHETLLDEGEVPEWKRREQQDE